MLKKAIALVLTMVFVLALAACGDSAPAQPQLPATSGTTAATTEPSPVPSSTAEVPTAPVPTIPTPEPGPEPEPEPDHTVPTPTPEPEPEPDEYFTLSGTPALGTVNGNTYTNESIGMTITLPAGVSYTFASEEDLLAANNVSSAAEISGLDEILIMQDYDSLFLVMAGKLGTEAVDNITNVEDALLSTIDMMASDLEELGTVTWDDGSPVFTAGCARGVVLTVEGTNGSIQVLMFGYQVGDYLVCTTITGVTEDVGTVLSWIDIA